VVPTRAETDAYVERFSDVLDEDGHQLVVRNGRARGRKLSGCSQTPMPPPVRP
jgi:hypothetical protein